MNKIKDLISAIIEGKNYSELFNVIIIEKVTNLLKQKKEEIATDLFNQEHTTMSSQEKC